MTCVFCIYPIQAARLARPMASRVRIFEMRVYRRAVAIACCDLSQHLNKLNKSSNALCALASAVPRKTYKFAWMKKKNLADLCVVRERNRMETRVSPVLFRTGYVVRMYIRIDATRDRSCAKQTLFRMVNIQFRSRNIRGVLDRKSVP